MSTRRGIAAALPAAFLLGCTAQTQSTNPAVSAPATPDELPRLVELQDRYPVSVAVESQGTQRRLDLVPDFKPPELTAEEKKKLGIRPPIVDFLALYRPINPDAPVGPYSSEIGNFGTPVDREVALGPVFANVFAQPFYADPAVSDPAPREVVSKTPKADPVSLAGPATDPLTAEDQPSKVAARQPHSDD